MGLDMDIMRADIPILAAVRCTKIHLHCMPVVHCHELELVIGDCACRQQVDGVAVGPLNWTKPASCMSKRGILSVEKQCSENTQASHQGRGLSPHAILYPLLHPPASVLTKLHLPCLPRKGE
jgi:hypothetical protein